MTSHYPHTRSRSRGVKATENENPTLDPEFMPRPLNIRKSNGAMQTKLHQEDVAVIGMAISDPETSALPPIPPKPAGRVGQFHYPFHPDSNPQSNTEETQMKRDSKTRGKRWKAFGSLFSKKETSNRTELARPANIPALRPEWQEGASRAPQSSRKRAGSDKEKAMEKSRVLESQMARRPSLVRRASSKKRTVGKRKPSQARVDRTGSNRTSAVLAASASTLRTGLRQNGPSRPLQDFSLMKIDIPHAEMERYSIMFSHALGGTANGSQTSLLRSNKPWAMESQAVTRPDSTRRESENSQRGRNGLGDIGPQEGLGLAKPGQRNGSVSSQGKTPSFSLFPSTSTTPRGNSPARSLANKPLPKPSPLGRSVTSPNIRVEPAVERPAIKPMMSDTLMQPTVLIPSAGKENIPVSRWNRTHSRQGSRASSSGDRPPSRDHVANLSIDSTSSHQIRHTRNTSLEPPQSMNHQRQPSSASSKFLDVSEFSSNNSSLSGPAVPSMQKHPQIAAVTSAAAFPARKSSLKRPGPRPERKNSSPPPRSSAETSTSAEGTAIPPNPLRAHPSISDLSAPSAPLLATANPIAPEPFHAPAAPTTFVIHAVDDVQPVVSRDLAPKAEVSIARQISITRRQKQQLVPVVVAKTARQPVQPLLVPGEEVGRIKSVVGGLECGTPMTAVGVGDGWEARPEVEGWR